MTPYLIMLALTLLFSVLYTCSVRGGVPSTAEFPLGGKGKRLKVNLTSAYLFASFLPMYLINSLMYYVGNDYKNYFKAFADIEQNQDNYMDFAFNKINLLVSKLGLDFQAVYFICCAIGYVLLFKCIHDYSANMTVSLLLFFATGYFYLLGMNQLRQFIAVMIVFYAYRLIPKGRFIAYCLLVLIAALFHFSAVVMIPAYFILKMRMRASYFVILAMILAPLNLFYSKVLNILYAIFRPHYVGSSFSQVQLFIDLTSIVGILLVCFLILIYYDEIVKRMDPLNEAFVNGVFLTVIVYVFCSWIPQYPRFTYYIYLPMICLLPNILLKEKNQYLRVLMLSGIVGYYWFICVSRNAPNWGVYPYVSIFSK